MASAQTEREIEAVARYLKARDAFAEAWVDLLENAPFSHLHLEDEYHALVGLVEKLQEEGGADGPADLPRLPAPKNAADLFQGGSDGR